MKVKANIKQKEVTPESSFDEIIDFLSPSDKPDVTVTTNVDDKEITNRAMQYLTSAKQAELVKAKQERLALLDKKQEDKIKTLYEIEAEKELKSKIKVKKKNSIPWRNYFIYLIIITSLSCCFTFSKYITDVSGDSTGSVAKFDVQVNSPDLLVSASPSNPNSIIFDGYVERNVSSKTRKITVKNNSDVTVNVGLSVSGNHPKHSISISNTNFTLLSNESQEVTITIYRSTADALENVAIVVDSSQAD